MNILHMKYAAEVARLGSLNKAAETLMIAQPNISRSIKELWHGNIIPQEDSRTNLKEMKEMLGYMSRHHEDLEKSFSDEQREIFEKFHDCWSEYMSLVEAAIFEYAFKLGMQIAIETLTE